MQNENFELTTFATDLGWMALLASRSQVKQIVFGHTSGAAALRALDVSFVERADLAGHWAGLIERLKSFAAGHPVAFLDVPIDTEHLAPFQQEVVRHCRAIPYGQTCSYGELAALAGSPRAARAVGSTMAQNRFGLVVPCHRVINSNGSPGSYGGPEGERMKLRLLALEQRGLVSRGKSLKANRPKRVASS